MSKTVYRFVAYAGGHQHGAPKTVHDIREKADRTITKGGRHRMIGRMIDDVLSSMPAVTEIVVSRKESP